MQYGCWVRIFACCVTFNQSWGVGADEHIHGLTHKTFHKSVPHLYSDYVRGGVCTMYGSASAVRSLLPRRMGKRRFIYVRAQQDPNWLGRCKAACFALTTEKLADGRNYSISSISPVFRPVWCLGTENFNKPHVHLWQCLKGL